MLHTPFYVRLPFCTVCPFPPICPALQLFCLICVTVTLAEIQRPFVPNSLWWFLVVDSFGELGGVGRVLWEWSEGRVVVASLEVSSGDRLLSSPCALEGRGGITDSGWRPSPSGRSWHRRAQQPDSQAVLVRATVLRGTASAQHHW